MASPSVELRTENIPATLKKEKRWAVYKLEPKNDGSGGYNKAPRGADMRSMSWKDPANHLTYEEALTTYRGRNDCDGIGLFLGDGLHGFDIDKHVIDGFISPLAQTIIDSLDSYTEFSPSGKGIHILFRGDDTKLPGDMHKDIAHGLEYYWSDRFFTITGNTLDGHTYIKRQNPVTAYRFIDPTAKDQQATPSVEPSKTTGGTCLKTADQVMTELAFLYGDKARSLWNGDLSGADNDASLADFKLCCCLAGVCECDPVLMDAAFRQSKLYRSKWDERHGAQTYGELTISRAINGDGGSKKPFDPENYQRFVKSRVSKAVESNMTADIPETLMPLLETIKQATEAPSVVLENLTQYMADGFRREVESFRQYDGISTGWPELDEQLGSIYPGLYLVGAAPSSGKTTFCWQLAENLAEQGHPVIFFTLEQSRLELISKSLARRVLLYRCSLDPMAKITSPSALEIRKGWAGDGLEQAIDQIEAIAPNLFIVPGAMGFNVESIKATVEQFITDTGRRPFVFVDYMQLLTTSDQSVMRDRRLMIDHVAKTLKLLQRDNGLSLFVVTAYSRDGYYLPTELGSGKESGGLEYTCDCQWGIDFACLHEQKYDNKGKAAYGVAMAKTNQPRRMILTCVKNRMGNDFKVPFHYHSRHDYFAVNKRDKMLTDEAAAACDGIIFDDEDQALDFEELIAV